jgi:SAM-dependent methyltransferase
VNTNDFDSAEFWKDPKNISDELKRVNGGKFWNFCQPEFYLRVNWGEKIASYVFNKYAQRDWTILETGCNTGKVISALIGEGFENISGIEINPHAIEIGRNAFPALKNVEIINANILDVIKEVPEVDVIYSCGVYMHIPPKDDWVFEEIAQKARRMILTTENEKETDFYKWGRNYRTVFESLGWRQVEEQRGGLYPPLPDSSIIRVFVK